MNAQILMNACRVIFLSFVSTYAMAQANEVTFSGHAYSLEGDQLLYVEYHSIESDPDHNRTSSTVRYHHPDGSVFAHKQLTYDESGFFPDFKFLDDRNASVLQVKKIEDQITIQQGAQTKPNSESLDAAKQGVMIADAGFDVFMVKNWSELVSGKAMKVEFLAPTRNMFVTFDIQRTFINDTTIGFNLAPNNFFISLLVDPIKLEYDLKSGRILSYKGLTNIEKGMQGNMTGENYVAHIRYEYPEQGPELDTGHTITASTQPLIHN